MEGFLFIISLIISALYYNARKKIQSIEKGVQGQIAAQMSECEKEKTALNFKLVFLENQNRELSKYQSIIDAEAKAKELIANAEADMVKATSQAKDIRSEASRDAKEIRSKAEKTLSDATISSKRIIDDAYKKAEEIGGDAFKALQNINNLEKSLKAIKNTIEGYGNQYLVPTYSILDELADEFGYTEAGEELKRIREQIKMMVKNRVAGQCDYVEEYRRGNAIDFVVDAFNGKVDSILASMKRENFGILEQKIKDAYQVVNLSGQAFKNAVITNEYLQARLSELKWGIVLNELKFQEREEQRLLKEKIREEEKARREYEKALKDAEKEEDMLRKAIEKAEKEVSKSSEAQRADYEMKLQDLMLKLKQAEDKSQRALSMAQQTKAGNVYIISNIGSFGENVFKIGMTRRLEPLDRIRELGDASVPFEFDVHAMIYSDDAPKLENELHKKFLQMQLNKVNPRKEFFKLSLASIKSEIDKLSYQTKWTLIAEAREYRESLAIEEAIATDENKKNEWLKYQLEEAAEIELEQESIEG